MNDLKISDLQPKQDKLQGDYEKAQAACLKAKAKLAKAKGELTTFNNKYGRVLQLMSGDK